MEQEKMLSMEINRKTKAKDLYKFITENMSFRKIAILYLMLKNDVQKMAYFLNDEEVEK